jgi:hypothetical protein
MTNDESRGNRAVVAAAPTPPRGEGGAHAATDSRDESSRPPSCDEGVAAPRLPRKRRRSFVIRHSSFASGLLLALATTVFAAGPAKKRTDTPLAPVGPVDLTKLQCGNLVYADNKSSVCFADRFLSDVARDTNLKVAKNFCPVKLGADGLFDYPFCVMSGNETFALPPKERENLKKYLLNGGFLLASPGCSDVEWDKSFRKELKLIFPDVPLQKIPMDHAIFSTVHKISRLTEKQGKQVMLEGLELNGRLVLVYSKEGLNDVHNAKGCCCCGGNEIANPAKVNVNVFTYAVLY